MFRISERMYDKKGVVAAGFLSGRNRMDPNVIALLKSLLLEERQPGFSIQASPARKT